MTTADQERLIEFLKDFGELGDKLDYEGRPRRGYTTVPAAAGTPGVLLGDVPSVSEVFATGVGRYFSFEFEFDGERGVVISRRPGTTRPTVPTTRGTSP